MCIFSSKYKKYSINRYHLTYSKKRTLLDAVKTKFNQLEKSGAQFFCDTVKYPRINNYWPVLYLAGGQIVMNIQSYHK